MNKETCMKEAEESILHTYNRFPVVFDHGEGVYLYDTDGKEYLDFAAGIAVQAFGYHKSKPDGPRFLYEQRHGGNRGSLKSRKEIRVHQRWSCRA